MIAAGKATLLWNPFPAHWWCYPWCCWCLISRRIWWEAVQLFVVSTAYHHHHAHLFVVRCLRRCQAYVQAVALSAAFRNANNLVVKSTILLMFQHSHLLSVQSQCAIRCDNMCLVHYCPAPSEQSMFLTKSRPTGNVKPNFSPPQSYASPTPYAPVLAHRTVHTVVPSIVAWGNKNLHTYSKLWNKDHRFEGLLRFKKPNISWKLFLL